MADFDLEFEGLTEFQEDLLDLANEMKSGTKHKQLLRKTGNKFRTQVKNTFKAQGIGTGQGATKQIEKSFKRGKPYKYKGKDWSIRAYSAHPLTHLLNNGHMNRDGGFTPGWHFLEKGKKAYEEEYFSDVSDWLDDLLKNEGL